MDGWTDVPDTLLCLKVISTRSASGVEEPGHSDEEWATGTRRHKWTRDKNRVLLEVTPAEGVTSDVGTLETSIPSI